MRVRFGRQARAGYTVSVHRSDGVVLSLRAAGASAALPHDLAHFVIEDELGLRQGFWGCVAEGAVVPGMEVVSGRRRPHASERSRDVLKAAGQRAVEAELMVTVFLELALGRRDERDPPGACNEVNRAWRPTGASRPELGAAEVQRICAAIRAARERWRALEPGEALTLEWPQAGTSRRAARRR